MNYMKKKMSFELMLIQDYGLVLSSQCDQLQREALCSQTCLEIFANILIVFLTKGLQKMLKKEKKKKGTTLPPTKLLNRLLAPS